jgi:nitroreductase
MTISAAEAHRAKHAPAVDGVLPIILERWSPRSYDSREVSLADLRLIFEAARWAPSSSNEQPWRYLVGRRNSQTHSKIAACLNPGNQIWAAHVAVLMLGVARTRFARNDTPNAYAFYDLGAATMLITLQAAALGLVTHQMAGFDHAAIRTALGIPEDFLLGSVMAIGHQGEPSALPNEKLLGSETATRTRKPLSEIAFSAWNEPLDLA